MAASPAAGVTAVEGGQCLACLGAERLDLVGQRLEIGLGGVEPRGHLGIGGRRSLSVRPALPGGWSSPVTMPAAPSAMATMISEPDQRPPANRRMPSPHGETMTATWSRCLVRR